MTGAHGSWPAVDLSAVVHRYASCVLAISVDTRVASNTNYILLGCPSQKPKHYQGLTTFTQTATGTGDKPSGSDVTNPFSPCHAQIRETRPRESFATFTNTGLRYVLMHCRCFRDDVQHIGKLELQPYQAAKLHNTIPGLYRMTWERQVWTRVVSQFLRCRPSA